MEKPKKPEEPNIHHYEQSKAPTGKNINGEPIYGKPQYILDYKRYREDLKRYEIDLDLYNQTKLIKLIKNADPKYILKKYKITRR